MAAFTSVLAIMILCIRSTSVVVVAEKMGEMTVGVVATRLGEHDQMLGGTFEPTIQWTRQGKIADYDFTAGISAKETANGDFSYDLLGRLKRKIRGWIYDAQLDTSSSDLNTVHTAFRITAPSNTLLSVDGRTDVEEQALHWTAFAVEQPFTAKDVDGIIRIKCPVDPAMMGSTTVQLDCGYRDTFISLDGRKDRQALTLVQSFKGGHEAGPTITSDGVWQMSYACSLPKDKGAVIGTYRPNGALSLEYRGGPVSVNLDVPLEGFYQIKQGARLSFRQSVYTDSSN